MEFEMRRPRGRKRPSEEVPWDRILVIAPVVVVLLVIGYLAASSFYTVAEHEKAVVLQFGKYSRTVGPGLKFRMPLVETVLKVSVGEQSLRLPFGLRASRPKTEDEEETLMLTGDLDAVLVEWTIQWAVVQPQEFLFRFYKEDDPGYPERLITTVTQTVMNQLVGDYSIDEVLTEKRGEIEGKALEQTQKILDQYQCGVGVRDLQLQRTLPPNKVRPAYEQVNASEQQREQLKNEANKERNKLLPEAEAEKDKMINEAKGYAKRRWAEADGAITALLDKYRAYRKAPDITRQRLYLEAMEEILSNVESKVVIDADLKGVLPLLPLEQGASHE